MLSSKIYRNSTSREIRRIEIQDFESGDGSGGWGIVRQTDFVPAGKELPSSAESPSAASQPSQPSQPTEAQIEAIRQEAFAEGHRAGLEEARQHFGQATEALAQGLEEVSRLRESLLQGSSHDMLRLVMSVARQVVQAEISARREVVLKTVERALSAAVQADSHILRVHPEDLALVSEKKPLFLASINGLKNLNIEGDPEIERGGCRLDSEMGEVDATIAGQLQEIQRTLLSSIEEG